MTRFGDKVTRRDILHGLGALGLGSLTPGQALADAVLAMENHDAGRDYPPAKTGLRGNHDGSWEVAHTLARAGSRDWGPVEQPDAQEYDLVVVGAGISGLSAAWFYQQRHPDARILILENHDDFGGHAKRNEFTVGGKTVLGYGGSQTLELPSEYPEVTQGLLRELGVNLKDFDSAYDDSFFQRHGLTAAAYFNKASWGEEALVPFDLGGLSDYLPLAKSPITAAEAVARMPISEVAQAQILRVLDTKTDQLPDMGVEETAEYLYSISYREYLRQLFGVTDDEAIAVMQDMASDSGVGIESVSAGDAILYSGLPGYEAAGFPPFVGDKYIHHYPDGNAAIARALVQKLIPAVSDAKDMAELVTARFDYRQLDRAGSAVRLRLNSTVVNVTHRGKPNAGTGVSVTYVESGKAARINAKAAVLACYNAIIPALCPELPKRQREALSLQVKSPVLYTNVALKNWRAFAELGVGAAVCPGSYHINAMLDFPVSMGDYQYSSNPDQPIVVHMERFPYPANSGLDRRSQYRWGRHQLLSTSYDTIEQNIVEQLNGMLAAGGFDASRDISAITVNRWAHGYAYDYDFLEEDYYEDWNDRRYPHVRGRKTFGSIAIANSDAEANALLPGAVGQAWRAVNELR